jgi:voltage-gated potassium channel
MKPPARRSPFLVTARRKLFIVIFGHDTQGGKAFDIVLLVAICGSVAAVMLESVAEIRARFGRELYVAEWTFTILFTVEYFLRLISVRRPLRYVFSPLGLVDLLSILPTYLSVLIGGAQTLAVVRALRLLRVFRILKLPNYVQEANYLIVALRASQRKIVVFLFTVVTITLIVGALMYLIEGEEHGFANIPISMYWAIVTLTTVGYGDIAPQTPAGRTLAAAVMILGYAIIAVPTGIVTAQMVKTNTTVSTRTCRACAAPDHDADAKHCKYCGVEL